MTLSSFDIGLVGATLAVWMSYFLMTYHTHPDSSALSLHAAMSALEIQDYTRALSHLENCLIQDLSSTRCRHFQLDVLLRLGREKQAEEAARNAIARDPGIVVPYRTDSYTDRIRTRI